MNRDRWAERTARELIQSAWRPGEDIAERRTRVIAETIEEIERLDDQLQHEHDDLAMLTALVVEKLELERQIAERHLAAAEQILETDKERRALDAQARRAETRARRATEGPRLGVVARHLDLDPSAWQALNERARRDRITLMALAGGALTNEAAGIAAGELHGSPSSRRRRSPGEGPPRPADRVARLVITEVAWQQLADAAAQSGLTVARYAGEVIEARAHELGWRGLR
jgi:predicted DNA-binding ribbon-helix-helix protein